MSTNLPEGAYVIDNGKFNLTDKFENYAREQGLTIESTRSLKAELEQFYGPGKKLHALEPYMKKTIERKVGEAREQLASATKALKGVTLPQEAPVQVVKTTTLGDQNPNRDIAQRLVSDTTAGRNFKNLFNRSARENI